MMHIYYKEVKRSVVIMYENIAHFFTEVVASFLYIVRQI